MTAYLVIGFFVLSAIVLLWLGRERKDPIARKGAIEAGMTEAEVLASVGPPQEIRRPRDPLDAGFFASSRKEVYVYANNRAVHFERGHVVGVSHVEVTGDAPSPPPQLIENLPSPESSAVPPFDEAAHLGASAPEAAPETTAEARSPEVPQP